MALAMKNTRKHFCFVSTEQKADEAKEVLDKANFCPMPATWEFSFRGGGGHSPPLDQIPPSLGDS